MSGRREFCLTCRHMDCAISAPPEWKPDFPGDEFRRWELRDLIRRTHNHQKISCTLNPVWREFHSNHYCGQFEHAEQVESLSTILWGGWSAQEHAAITAKNVKLQNQLDRARQVSASRLARLKKQRSKDHGNSNAHPGGTEGERTDA